MWKFFENARNSFERRKCLKYVTKHKYPRRHIDQSSVTRIEYGFRLILLVCNSWENYHNKSTKDILSPYLLATLVFFHGNRNKGQCQTLTHFYKHIDKKKTRLRQAPF